MKELAFIAMLSGTALAADAAAVDAPHIVDAQRTLDHATFTQDTRVEAHHLVLESGGGVRIENGSHLVISTDILEIRGPFLFDGRGTPGAAGATQGEWRSSGPCSVGLFGPGEVAHRDWEAAGGEPARGGNGGNGGNGATITIEYRELRFSSGVSGRPGDFLTVLVDGGAGGAGGAGRRLVCGCHSEHVKYGAAGTPGTPGVKGHYEIRQRI